jgi:dCMP deaminase
VTSKWTDDFWMGMAWKYAQEGSKDPSTKVGCVIVRPDRTPASWGTNGFPQGIKDTPERLADKTFKYPHTIHAELNAIIFAGERLEGCTAYTTFAPCTPCAMAIIQAKIARVVTRPITDGPWAEGQHNAQDRLREAGVEVVVNNSWQPPVELAA